MLGRTQHVSSPCVGGGFNHTGPLQQSDPQYHIQQRNVYVAGSVWWWLTPG